MSFGDNKAPVLSHYLHQKGSLLSPVGHSAHATFEFGILPDLLWQVRNCLQLARTTPSPPFLPLHPCCMQYVHVRFLFIFISYLAPLSLVFFYSHLNASQTPSRGHNPTQLQLCLLPNLFRGTHHDHNSYWNSVRVIQYN